MQNYIDHEIKVKVIDSVLSQEREWQWFIDYVEANFELADVKTWVECENINSNLSDVYSYFIKILEIDIEEPMIQSDLLLDIFLVSKYYVGLIEYDNCKDKIKTIFGTVFLFLVWMTKLINLNNEDKYILNYQILTEKNYWKLVDITALLESKESLLSYSSNIKIDGWASLAECLSDNLNEISYGYSEDFFERNGKKLYNAAAFSFQSISHEVTNTWEESYLLDMLKVKFNNRKIIPTYIMGSKSVPDQRMWTLERINHLINFFNEPKATFVLETIRYVLYEITPSQRTKIAHCSLLTDYLKINKASKALSSSSFKIVSYLFEDKEMKDLLQDAIYLDMLKEMQTISNPGLISQLQDAHIPISKKQKNIVKENAISLYKTVENTNSLGDLNNYLCESEIPRYIDNVYFQKLHEKFLQLIETDSSILVSAVFYRYMLFLFEINNKGIDINKKLVRQAMIDIQEIWRKKYYTRQTQNMSMFMHESVIQNNEVNRYNDLALERPLEIARSTMITNEEDLCNLMTFISEAPLMYSVTHLEISEIYPKEVIIENYGNHEIYGLLKKQVDKIVDEKGYKFLNILDSDYYVFGVLDRYKNNITTAMALMVKDIDLYNHISSIFNDVLIEYDGTPKLAHVTQLFPLLEAKIRELATLTGFFPFKIQEENFMMYKDPSSILKEIIQTVYDETNDFIIIPDILFVYNCMFSGYSMNIRNELIHGRDYTTGSSLVLALKATLMSISMIEYRLNIIKENQSKRQ